ncbi:MAG: hypothetical protein HN509_06790 [Halobacteriovoraceae bacterium]|nr:hypothetical protein [Halobacteriovoraceae bacterium]MBT5095593.1 hypothetical protein [Halobacteriovoraceae bacterium]
MKLVSGKNIGAVAVGVVKAGADIIQISGGDGGTGAASLLSMKHAGLPLETGLIEVHHSLVKSGLRGRVVLRADGGLLTGKDLLIAAVLGADQFDFGKIVLVAEGCIMARICEKNTCPTGIATHDKKFKAHYNGTKQKVVTLLKQLAQDLQYELAAVGYTSLKEVRGRTELLALNPKTEKLALNKGFDLSYFKKLSSPHHVHQYAKSAAPNKLNKAIVEAVNAKSKLEFEIKNTDRAIPASLAGLFGAQVAQKRLEKEFIKWNKLSTDKAVTINFKGSAGQGFGIFLSEKINIHLEGEANDSVGKGLCGGEITVIPPKEIAFNPSDNSIIGNCALYGATSGSLLVYGKGGDRFAVRNSGAEAIIEGVGIHACEYMTGGKVIILGQTLGNIGAGMTGGELYLAVDQKEKVNKSYIHHIPFLDEDIKFVIDKLKYYIVKTGSPKAIDTLAKLENNEFPLLKFVAYV